VSTPGSELVIPVRMDLDKALGSLKTVGAAAAKAGDQAHKAGADGESGFRGLGHAAESAGASVAGLLKAQFGLAAVKQTAQAIATQFNETSEYVMKMAREFQGLRKSMQEVAALRGQPNSSQFTIDEAQKAQAAGLTPQERRDFQAEFLNYAGSQVGGENGKLTEAQGEEYGNRVAAMMKSSGINPAIGAELAGSMLENAEGPQNVDELMKRFSTTFQVLQKGRVPLGKALPQLSQIMGHGISAEESAQLFSIVSPAAPGSEGTSVEAALRAIQEMKSKGTGEEFGVKKGMSQFESVEAFAKNLNQRQAKMMAGGDTEQMAQDKIAALLEERKVAADNREQRGLIAGFARQGVHLGGFERYRKIAKDTPDDFEAQQKATYEDGEAGRQNRIEIAQAVADAKVGGRNEGVLRRRQIAEVELTEGGAFENPSLNDRASGIFFGNLPGGADARGQQINRQAIARARTELGETPNTVSDNATALNTALTNKLLTELNQRVEEQNKMMQKDQQSPLISKPPNPNTRGTAP